MKLTERLIESKAIAACSTVKEVKYLDASRLGIAIIENVDKCSNVQTLILHSNNISIVENIALCHQLWHIDLRCNDITNLYALSRFIALGSLNLSFNDLSWSELMKIRHMHILELHLHSNKRLEKDPNYRVHVIDCLPAVWVLDGSLVTAGERVQVERFFQDSALSNRPVRHKLTNEQFIPSPLKKIQVEGTFGERAVHLMMRFPIKGPRNVETDKKRLSYLAYNLKNDMFLEYKYKYTDNNPFPLPDFESLVEARNTHPDQCNVLLLLLVTFLDFSLPFDLLQETITLAKLENLCEMDVRLLFAIPKVYICRLCVLLLSAIKIDRHDNKSTGLYDKLYLALHYVVEDLAKRMNLTKTSRSYRSSFHYKDLRALLACEIIQLFCIVPKFFQYATTNQAVVQLLSVATADAAILDKVIDLIQRIEFQGGDEHRLIEEVADFLVNAVQRSTKRILGKRLLPTKDSKYSLVAKRSQHRRPQSTPIQTSSFLATGRPSPERCITITRPGTASTQFDPVKPPWIPPRPPKLGDKVLLGPQNLSFIIALPEYDVALIQMESIPVQNGSVVSFSKNPNEHYAYLDLEQFEWDRKYSYWKPYGTKGDRIMLYEETSENPPTSPEGSPRTFREDVHDKDENETTTTIHPSPRDSMEDFPQPISMLIKEKLKLDPESEERKSSSKNTPNSPAEPVTGIIEGASVKLDLTDKDSLPSVTPVGLQVNQSGAEHLSEGAVTMGLLYDCVKCAVDTVKSNNEALSSARDTESKGVEQQEAMHTPPTTPTKQQKHRKASAKGHKSKKQLAEPPKEVVQQDETQRPATPHRLDLDLRLDGPHQVDFEKEKKEQLKKMQRPKSSSSYRPKSAASRTDSVSRPSTASSLRGHREQTGSPVMIQMGNFWLAGGRDLNYQERVENFKKTQHTPGWMDGLQKRPKSVGPHQQRRRVLDRRSIRSATIRRDQVWMGISPTNTQHHPSPATSELNIHVSQSPSPPSSPPEPNYMDQARQQNFGSPRPATPPYGGPKRPSSPLEMLVR